MAEIDICPIDNCVRFARTDCQILCNHTEKLPGVCPKITGFNSDGLREPDNLMEEFHKKLFTKKFERVSRKEVLVTDLITLQQYTLSDKPKQINGRNQSIHVEEYIKRRIQSPRHRVFGSKGSEYWYGGNTVINNQKLNQVWDNLEAKSEYRRVNFQKSNYHPVRFRQNLVITVEDFDNEIGNIVQSRVYSDWENELESGDIIWADKAYHVPWRDIGLPSEIIPKVPDRLIALDIRDWWRWVLTDIVFMGDKPVIPKLGKLAVFIHQNPAPDTTLKAEYNGLTHQQIADALNVRDQNILGTLKPWKVVKKAGERGLLKAIRNASEVGVSDQVKNAADAFLMIFTQNNDDVDMSDPDIQSIVDTLVSGGVIPAGAKTSLENMATNTLSKAEAQGIVEISDDLTANHIANAIGLRERNLF